MGMNNFVGTAQTLQRLLAGHCVLFRIAHWFYFSHRADIRIRSLEAVDADTD